MRCWLMAAAIAFGSVGAEAAGLDCSVFSDVVARSQCAADVATGAQRSEWELGSSKNAMDDSTSLWLAVVSSAPVKSQYGKTDQYAQITVRCHENKTAIVFTLGDNFLVDLDDYGVVTYRLDGAPAKTVQMTESTDNTALGLWNGGAAIPFIKKLFDHTQMVVRITPYRKGSIDTAFNIAGLKEAITPLRNQCGW